MKNICKNCQYQRAHGQMDFGILGAGSWCSNSQSPLFRMRVEDEDGCDVFSPRGKQAGVWLRLGNKMLSWLNKKTRNIS